MATSTIEQQLGAALLTIAGTELTNLTPTIVEAADKGITNAATQAKAALDKALTAHGALSLFAGPLTTPINAAIDALAATGENDVPTLIATGVAALAAEATKL